MPARSILLLLVSTALLSGCKPVVREPTAAELVCAKRDAVSRVNFRFVMDVEPQGLSVPGAELLRGLRGEPYLVRRRIVISGRDIEKVERAFDESGPALGLVFNSVGAAGLKAATAPHRRHERLALVVDDVVIAAPLIGPQIDSNRLNVSGLSEEEAWAAVDRVGAAARECVAPTQAGPPS